MISLQTEIPPSSNNQYVLVRRGRKTFHVPSRDLKSFQKYMEQYPAHHSMKETFEEVKYWKDKKLLLKCHSAFYFDHKRIFTKEGRAKKIDVSNHIKALHDCICKMLGIDDSLFFQVSMVKIGVLDPDLEYVLTEISPI